MSLVFRFVLGAVTDLALIPALFQVKRLRRHFELFVGVSQIVASLLFNTCETLGISIFIREQDWHFVSDVLSLSYVCCLLVHAMSIGNENVNIMLRYTAFAAAWVFKIRDTWDSGAWEALLISCYLIGAVAAIISNPSRLKKFKKHSFYKGASFAVVAVICLVLELEETKDPYKLLAGFGHCLSGGAFFFLWRAIPVFDSKKMDDFDTLGSSSGFV